MVFLKKDMRLFTKIMKMNSNNITKCFLSTPFPFTSYEKCPLFYTS